MGLRSLGVKEELWQGGRKGAKISVLDEDIVFREDIHKAEISGRKLDDLTDALANAARVKNRPSPYAEFFKKLLTCSDREYKRLVERYEQRKGFKPAEEYAYVILLVIIIGAGFVFGNMTGFAVSDAINDGISILSSLIMLLVVALILGFIWRKLN